MLHDLDGRREALLALLLNLGIRYSRDIVAVKILNNFLEGYISGRIVSNENIW